MPNRLTRHLPLLLALAASATLAGPATAFGQAERQPPPPASRLHVAASPTRFVLGRNARVALEVRVPSSAGPVRVAASSGTFVADRLDAGAVRTFHWTPPAVRHPLVVVFAFWVEAGDGPPDVTVLRLPLYGQTTLDVATAPGATVVVLLGETRFGPIQADARGKARVPVEVPPGVTSARVLATRGELRTDAAIPLDAPQRSPRVAALSPAPLPAEGGWLLVVGEEPIEAALLTPSLEGAKLEPLPGDGDVARFRVLPAPTAASVTVVIPPRGAEDEARAQAEVVRSLAPPVVTAVPVPVATTQPAPWRPSFHVLGGATFASGDNTGPCGALGVSLTAPWWGGRMAAQLESGLRWANFDGTVGMLGTVRSRVLAVPILLSVRMEVLQSSRFTLYGRAGGGVAPFRHRLSSDFQDEVKESKLSGMGFLAIQGAYRFGRWSALGELRGAWAPARTSLLDAQLGGVAALLGVGFAP